MGGKSSHESPYEKQHAINHCGIHSQKTAATARQVPVILASVTAGKLASNAVHTVTKERDVKISHMTKGTCTCTARK